jgi:DNA/RNA endonuclease G (NUC1)
MKKLITFISLLLLVTDVLVAQDLCTTGCGTNPCPLIQVRPGKTSYWDAGRPINLQEHFEIKYLPPGMTISDPSIFWFITDQYGSTSTVSNKNPATVTNYYFGGSPARTGQWGKIKVDISYKCPLDGLTKNSNTATLEVLNYGIHFFQEASPGNMVGWKFSKNWSSSMAGYLDKNKPTIIYIHGWNKGSVADKKRETLLDNKAQSMIKYWRDLGWNVGVYYWNQFADEDNVKDAENKIAAGTPGGDNRQSWRRSSGVISKEGAPDVNMTDLFVGEYYEVKSFLLGNGFEVRLAGHSLGSQITAQAVAKMTPPTFVPDRIALLDPWWSLDAQPAMAGAMAEVKNRNIPAEWYSTTKLQKFSSLLTNIKDKTGDLVSTAISKNKSKSIMTVFETLLDGFVQQIDYLTIVDASVYVDLTPTYDPTLQPMNPVEALTRQHNAAVWYYFTSVKAPPPAEAERVLSAADIRERTYDDMDDNNTIPFLYTNGSGMSASTNTQAVRSSRGFKYLQLKGRNILEADTHVQLASWGALNISLNRAALPFPLAEMNAVKTQPGLPDVLSSPAVRDDFRKVGTPVFLPGRQPAGVQPRIVKSAGTVDGKVWDSYLTMYNCTDLQPSFVTWHLSQNWMGSHKRSRSNFFASKVNCTTKTLDDDYTTDQMARGHLTPNSERNYSKEESDSTFLMENVAPHNYQQNSKNGWRKFEEYLSDIMVGNPSRRSSSASLKDGYNLEAWIVAGSSPADFSTTDFATDKNGTPVTQIRPYLDKKSAPPLFKSYSIRVPTHIWKVVLLHKPGQPFNTANCKMIGVWLPNRFNALGSWDNPVNNFQYIVSVDDIEARTGIDFFNALPGDNGRLTESILEAEKFDPRFYIRLENPVSASGSSSSSPLSRNPYILPGLIEEKACRQISLGEGFQAAAGIRFRAYIDPSMCVSPLRQQAPATVQKVPTTTFVALPNPTTGLVTVRFSGTALELGKAASISITDMQGRILLTRSIAVMKGNNQLLLDLAKYTPGAYLVQLQTSDGKVQITKLVKQ